MILLRCPYGHKSEYAYKETKYADFVRQTVTCKTCGRQFHRDYTAINITTRANPDLVVASVPWDSGFSEDITPTALRENERVQHKVYRGIAGETITMWTGKFLEYEEVL